MNAVTVHKSVLISAGDEKVVRVFEPSKVTADYCRMLGTLDLEATHSATKQALGLMTKTTEETIEVPN
jgi:hypothetical protein